MVLDHKQNLQQLIEGCQSGNRRAQELMYAMFSSKMLGICARYAKDRFEAEDILQTGFIRMFDKVKDFRNEGSFEGWLKRIMVNTAIEFYRKSVRMLPIVDVEHAESVVHQGSALQQMAVKDILAIVQTLAPGYRLIFNMYAIEGYNHREISEQLGISEGTSKSQLARARSILQSQINAMEGYKDEKIAR